MPNDWPYLFPRLPLQLKQIQKERKELSSSTGCDRQGNSHLTIVLVHHLCYHHQHNVIWDHHHLGGWRQPHPGRGLVWVQLDCSLWLYERGQGRSQAALLCECWECDKRGVGACWRWQEVAIHPLQCNCWHLGRALTSCCSCQVHCEAPIRPRRRKTVS